MMQTSMYDAFDDLPRGPVLVPAAQSPGPCAWCGHPAEGNYCINRDGPGVGPMSPLCDDHGKCKSPSGKMIRQRMRIRDELGEA